MSDDRWRNIEELFRRAADLVPAERAAFLAMACAGDERLRRKVESLLPTTTRKTMSRGGIFPQVLPPNESVRVSRDPSGYRRYRSEQTLLRDDAF